MCSRRPEADRERHLLLQIACSLYARDLLSLGKAAELAGIETVDFARKLGSRGIARHYTEAELASDAACDRVFENLFLEPIANGGGFHKIKESGTRFFEPGGDGSGLLDALEKVLHVMALFVKTFVILRRATFVGLWRNACPKSERLGQLPERSAAAGFVPGDLRRGHETDSTDWFGPETIVSTVIGFVENVGLFLENSIYNQVVLHRFGGPERSLEARPMFRRNDSLGLQTFQMCAPDEAFRITSVSRQLVARRASLRKLPALPDLKALHWINLNRHRVEFRTLHP